MIAIVDLFALDEWTWYSLAGAIALWVVSLLGWVLKKILKICKFQVKIFNLKITNKITFKIK